MGPQPVVTGLSPKEGPPGTRVTIRGEFLGARPSDLVGLTICGCDCLLSAEWKSPNKIIARTGPAKGKGDIIVTTVSGGVGTSTVQFRAYHETIGPMKECAVWIEESPIQILASWGRRTIAPSGYTQEDPLGLSIEGNEKKFPDDLRELFPDRCGDLSQENFSPEWFLLENHHTTSFEDLKAGLAFLKRKVESQKESQLSFLKSNAGSVIDQIDTLMNIRDKFREDTNKFSSEPLKTLEISIQNAISEYKNIFNKILQRREKVDSTRAALFALSRHKFLFCLPNSVDRSAESGDYDIVVNDYARARNLFGKTDIPLFKKVLEEVDIRIMNIRRDLHDKVIKMPQGVEQQKKFIKALINLEAQQVGTSVEEKLKIVDPAWDAINARSKYLDETFKQYFDMYTSKDINHEKPKLRDSNQPPNRVLFCEEVCDIASNHIPDLWRLGQSYFTGELRGSNDPKPDYFKRIVLNAIEKFCSYLRVATLTSDQKSLTTSVTLRQQTVSSAITLTWPSSSSPAIQQFLLWIPQCLRFIRITYATLIRLDLPSEALDIVMKLIDEIRLFCFTIIFKRSIECVKKLGEKEDWSICVEEFPGATRLPSLLEEIIKETLEEGQNACVNPEIREGNLLEAHSEGQREVSQHLQDMLKTFCDVIENLALQSQDDESHSPTISQLITFPTSQEGRIDLAATTKICGNPVTTWEQRILCCLANTAYCNQIFFQHIGTIFVKYGYPLPKLAIETSRLTVNQLFQNLLEVYVEHKGDPLVGTIEPSMYIGKFQWDTVQRAGKLRPYAQECCDNLVGVYSEIYTICPLLLRPILEPIVQTVAEELARLMSCVSKFNKSGEIQANIDIKSIRDILKLYSNETASLFFVEALDVIGNLSDEDNQKVEDSLKEIRKTMKLQILCFSVINP